MKAILNICISADELNSYVNSVKEAEDREPSAEEINAAFTNYFLEHSSEHLFMENIHVDVM